MFFFYQDWGNVVRTDAGQARVPHPRVRGPWQWLQGRGWSLQPERGEWWKETTQVLIKGVAHGYLRRWLLI